MKITIALIPGLPKKELVERIHFHQRQGDIAERALGFYLLDLEKRCSFPPLSPRGDGPLCRPFGDGSEWARKHASRGGSDHLGGPRGPRRGASGPR